MAHRYPRPTYGRRRSLSPTSIAALVVASALLAFAAVIGVMVATMDY